MNSLILAIPLQKLENSESAFFVLCCNKEFDWFPFIDECTTFPIISCKNSNPDKEVLESYWTTWMSYNLLHLSFSFIQTTIGSINRFTVLRTYFASLIVFKTLDKWNWNLPTIVWFYKQLAYQCFFGVKFWMNILSVFLVGNVTRNIIQECTWSYFGFYNLSNVNPVI